MTDPTPLFTIPKIASLAPDLPVMLDEKEPTMSTMMASESPQSSPAEVGGAIQFGKQYQEPPLQQIEELSKIHGEVPIRMQRRNAKGQLATLGSGQFIVPTLELAKVEEWVPPRWGGGSYRCEIRDPQMPTRVVFSFLFLIEGMPLPANAMSNGPAPGPGASPMQPYNPFAPAPPPMPAAPNGAPLPAGSAAWAQGLHPQERAYFQAPTAQFSSDQVAMEQLTLARNELAKMQAEMKLREERQAAELQRLREEAAAEKERAREAAHQAELKALSAKIDAMQSRPTEKTLIDRLPELAPFVPVIAAWVSSKTESEKAQLQHQMQGFQAMIQASTVKAPPQDTTKDLLMTLAPIIMPLVSKAMERGSPDEQAKLFQALADSHLNTISMAAQLVEATAPPPESATGAAVRQFLDGVKQVALGYMTSQGGLPGQLPSGPRPAGVLNRPAQVGGGYTTIDDAGPVTGDVVPTQQAPAARAQPKPASAELGALFAMLPSDFQSAEWQTILHALHSEPPADADRVATLLAGHLEHLINFQMVPALLSTITEKPRETLETILEKLPVAGAHPDYARAVLDKTLSFLMEDGYLPRPPQNAPAEAEGQPDDGESDETEGEAAEE